MRAAVTWLTQAVLQRLEPERAHAAGVALLRMAPLLPAAPDDAALAVDAFGLRFPNPIGLAAGFDKNGECAGPALRAGFGFTEIGTITPLPQAGNPRPRVFRLPADAAVINRYGFNNDGHEAVHRRLARQDAGGIVGVNIGANKTSEDRRADYVAGIRRFADVASYFALNVSSPNTPGLRSLQDGGALDALLASALEAREAVAGPWRPVLLKIAPDLDLRSLDTIVAVARRRRIDGMIVANTTLARSPLLKDRRGAQEAGGLSGRPLFHPSTRLLAETFVRVERQFPLIGVGGIDSAATARAKIRAGATLVQLYSGLVYGGLALLDAIKRDLSPLLSGPDGLREEIGADAAALVDAAPVL